MGSEGRAILGLSLFKYNKKKRRWISTKLSRRNRETNEGKVYIFINFFRLLHFFFSQRDGEPIIEVDREEKNTSRPEHEEVELRKSEIVYEYSYVGVTSSSFRFFLCFLFYYNYFTSMFIPSFVINKNRYIVVWAAAWRQTNRQATNYSNNSSSSSNSNSNNW